MSSKQTPEGWIQAALGAIAEGGVANVSVERLAKALGVTKGSFYWHFTDRAALIEAALIEWELAGTTELLAELLEVEDPQDRLHQFVWSTVGDPEHGDLDVALSARSDDPVAGPIIRRVMAARVSFVSRTLRDLGMTSAKAEKQARIVVSAYLGHFQLRAAMPDDKYMSKPAKAYIEQLIESVAGL